VEAENGEDRSAVPQAAQQKIADGHRQVRRREVGLKRRVVVCADQRRRADGQEQQQRMPPDAVLKLGKRTPHLFRRGRLDGIVAKGFQ
jgi:hypothetical protein